MGESVLTAVYTINRVPTTVIGGMPPYECLYGKKPNYSELRVFGSTCFVLLPERERHKLGQNNVLCVFLGYGIEQKGYRCYDPVNIKLRVSRHVTFWEKVPFWSLPSIKSSSFESFTYSDPFPSESNPSTFLISTPESPSPLVVDPPNTDDQDHSTTQPNSATQERDPDSEENSLPPRNRRPPAKYADYHCSLSSILSFYEPKTYREAAAIPEWQDSMDDELEAHVEAGTWEMVDLPPRKSVVGSRWVYKVKTKSDGEFE